MMPRNDVLAILSVLRRAGADVVIAGGWGIDALLGEETREHRDLDLLHVREQEPAVDRAGRECAGGLTEERAVARATYEKAEPTALPAFADEADEAKAYRFTVLDVKGKLRLYEYLTVVRSGSTTLAFRAEILGTKDIGGVPQDVMAAQWRKFRATRA
ncbi:hypothetical protein OG596_10310 [Streptomyces sp. NBC_01102]|uniref:nucleotidyltransferase domain-containing protein n=1 Tax=Streptomyces sp. NBC_01102 TaxID=2903749 RepID=UPI00386C5D9B|nr:hypothetical protein OG596_10310 [Streptomyces sp. NBC_01102]